MSFNDMEMENEPTQDINYDLEIIDTIEPLKWIDYLMTKFGQTYVEHMASK